MKTKMGVKSITLTVVAATTTSSAAGKTSTGEFFILFDPQTAVERVQTKLVRRELELDKESPPPPILKSHE